MKRRFFVILFPFISTVQIALAQEVVSLERVIDIALENNYDVKLERNAAASAATDNAYSWGGFLPQISTNATTVWNDNRQTLEFQDASRNNKGIARSNNVSATVQLNWTLFDGTRMFATRERLAAIASQGEMLVKNQMVNTIAEVIINYYDIVRQKQQLRAIREQMAVSEERVKLAEKKLQVGTGAKPELLQARVDLNEQRAQVIQQEIAIEKLKEQLNALAGKQLPSNYDVADTIIINLNLQREDIFENIDNTNFSLLAARENINIANLSLSERRAEQFPFINFISAYNYSRTDNARLINPFGPVFNLTNGFNYGFSLTLPILTNLNTRRLIQQAKINAHRQLLLYNQLRTNVDMNLRNAYIEYENAREILLIEEENILLARENVSIALEGFKRGITTFIELRTAQQSLAGAYSRLIAARYNAKVAETELLRLNGSLLQ